ncbi:MAG: hypothetical protein ACXWLH_01580 [Candidatus Saccharimonadales bacterium]
MEDTVLLPLIYNYSRAREELKRVVDNLPLSVDVYLIGGAIRNALFRHYHGRALKQRDYDQIITKSPNVYIDYLYSMGFVAGEINRPMQRVMRKSLFENVAPEDHDKWIVFDMHLVDSTKAIDNLKYHVGLTVNAFAISLRDIFSSDWQSKLISLPGAVDDIKGKRLRVNMEGYKDQAANFFAVLRFMHAGFLPPPKNELKLLLDELPKIEHNRYQKNVDKVFTYVGGEDAARRLVYKLGIDVDVFNENDVKKHIHK